MEHTLLLNMPSIEVVDNTTSQLRQEYQSHQRLFQAQPGLVQQHLHLQAASTVEAVLQGSARFRFMLPDRLAYPSAVDGKLIEASISPANRVQLVGSHVGRPARAEPGFALSRHLFALERSGDPAIAAGAGLLRYSIATHMAHTLLPAGKSVVYKRLEGDDIPTQPVDKAAAINPDMDLSLDTSSNESERGEMVAPYVKAAQRFYLPQWVAFDDQGNLLVNNLGEAEAHIASMQRYMYILYTAIVIAPYMVADEAWQQKRYGMLGQLVNQGRATCHYQLQGIVQTIQRRVAQHRLDRGLWVDLPYFDDQKLAIESYQFIVIPAGRVMFIPAFAVLAAREQRNKVAANTQLSYSTRKHLLAELQDFETAFIR